MLRSAAAFLLVAAALCRDDDALLLVEQSETEHAKLVDSLEAVRGRFRDYEASDVRDMRAVYEALVLRQPAELRRISALEIFDDPDEFNLIMAHYCFALAGSGAAVDVARGLAAQLDAA